MLKSFRRFKFEISGKMNLNLEGWISEEHGGQRGDGQPLEGLGKRRGRVRITDMFNVS